jgi:signal transduction histidine kinase
MQPVEAAMEAQNRFASDASHELRTPLTIMQAENEEGLHIAHLPPAARQLINSNLEEIARLKALSEGLLQLTHEDKELALQPIWVDDIATEVINRMVRPAQAKQIVIEDAWPHSQVLAHGPALTQIILILLDNALKYSLPKTTIYLESTQLGQTLQLHVRDTGVGINASSVTHIFDRFYRADSSRTKQHVEGHGLGLSIAQKLANQQNSKISVVSTPGEGSVFSVTLQLVV